MSVWLENPLNDVLSSRGKVAVLRVLCQVDVPLAGREIARRAGLGSGHASGILRDLTASGVLLTRDQGRVNTYELAPPSSLITHHLKGLFAAEAKRRHEVVRGLSEAVPGMVSVILFGSEARGDATPGSDTDLLVVVEKKTKRLEEQIGEVCLRLATEHQLDLTWLVTDQKQVRGWEADGSEFWRNVRSEGITLAGATVERLAR